MDRVLVIAGLATGVYQHPGQSAAVTVAEGSTDTVVILESVPATLAGGVVPTLTVGGETRAIASVSGDAVTLAAPLSGAPAAGAAGTVAAEWARVTPDEVAWLFGAASSDPQFTQINGRDGQFVRGVEPGAGVTLGLDLGRVSHTGVDASGGKPLRAFYLRGIAGDVEVTSI